MDFLEAAAQAGFIREPDRRAFIEALTRTSPRPDDVLVPHPEEERLQGDLFEDVEHVRLNSDGEAKVRHHVGMVLNNSCDLQPDRSDCCNVALAMDYARFAEGVQSRRGDESAAGFLRDAEANKVDDLLFLKPCPNYDRGLIVFLNAISTLPIQFYEKALKEGNRIGSLSQHGFYFFLIKLTRFLARIESADVARQS